jgi:hypothetical protein
MSGTLARILGRIGIPDLVQRLADALPGADFTSLMLEVGDGGDVDWTARLTSNSKERCVISGLGVDRLALG